MAPEVTFEDWLAVQALVHKWADSYDAKDWETLGKIAAPELLIDYSHVSGQKWDAMKPDEYVAMVSDPGFLGDPLLRTQHLLGMTRWEKRSDDLIVGHHQLRAAHVRYADETQQEEVMRGHSHATNEHYYRLVDGEWKFAGLKPCIRWNEYDFENVFKGFKPPTKR